MIGKQILHYRVLEELGRGGMGVVYKARDTRLDRDVAIKFLPGHIASNAEERTRFETEAKAAAALNHPNIATIHAIEEVDDEMFIVMEFIEGKEFKQLSIDNRQLSIESTVDYALQIVKGLHAAHAKGIVHRDIKSSNIMVTESGQIKIMDFGLAKVHGGAQVTKVGTTLGTAAFMSPEQARGEEADHRSDIWAFGVVLYEMLACRLPFPGDYEQAVIYSILNEEPESVTEIRDDIPQALAQIVHRTLAKKPEERYENTHDLIQDLQALKGDTGTSSFPSHTLTQPPTPKQSSRRLLWPVAIITVIILLTAGYFLFTRDEEPAERVPIAVVDFVNQTGEPELDGLSGMLITALEQSRRLAVMSRARMYDVYKQMNQPDLTFVDEVTGREIAKRANIDALAVATIRRFDQLYSIDFRVLEPQTGDRLFSTKVEAEGKKSIPGLLDKLAQQTRIDLQEQAGAVQLASQGVAEVTTPNLEAYHHYFKGQEYIDKLDFAKAKEEFRKAIALDSTFALAHYRLAYAMGWYSEGLASEPLKVALRHIDRIPEKERYLVRAEQLRLEYGFTAAVAALKEMEKHYPNEKEMLFAIGDYSFHANDFETAVQYFDKVLLLDPNHERALFHYDAAFTSRYLASSKSGDLNDILHEVQQARKKKPDLLEWYTIMGKLYLGLEQYDKAEAEFLEYIAKSPTEFSKTSGQLRLLATYAYSGRYRKLQKSIDEEITAAFARSDTAVAISWMISKGIFTMGQSDFTTLSKLSDRLLEFKDRIDVPFLLDNVVLFLAASGRVSEAVELQMELQNPVTGGGLASRLGECDKGAATLAQIKDIQEVPSSLKMRMFYELAECQFGQGDLEQAEINVREAQRVHTTPGTIAFLLSYRGITYPKTYLLLGKISEARGETRQAIQYYQKFLDLWKNADDDLPDLLETQRRLSALQR